MAPQRQRKRKSTASTSTSSGAGLDNFPVPPQLVATKAGQTPTGTPRRSPLKPEMRITQAQKQALIDNLQLEITERARKLRAQYALQAQGLRTRMEIRIHRIPAALRKVTMGELYEKHTQKTKPAEQSAAPNLAAYRSPSKAVTTLSPPKRMMPPDARPSRKRASDELEEDKENAPSISFVKPAKRIRTASPTRISPNKPSTTSTAANARVASRRLINPSREALSPRSNNSRTLPQSPYKAPPILPSSPYKSNVPRPVSPLKPAAPNASSLAKAADKPKAKAAGAGSRAASRQNPTTTASGTVRAKRNAAPKAQAKEQDDASGGRTSSASNGTSTSAGTTVVKKSTRVTRGAPSATAKSGAGTAKGKTTGLVKRMAAGINAKKVGELEKTGPAAKTASATVKGGRTLRKRP